MMFTATWPKEVRRMATNFFRDSIEVRVGNADELQANPDIDQQVRLPPIVSSLCGVVVALVDVC